MNDEMIKCPECNGEGFVLLLFRTDCKACDGSGRLKFPIDEVLTPEIKVRKWKDSPYDSHSALVNKFEEMAPGVLLEEILVMQKSMRDDKMYGPYAIQTTEEGAAFWKEKYGDLVTVTEGTISSNNVIPLKINGREIGTVDVKTGEAIIDNEKAMKLFPSPIKKEDIPAIIESMKQTTLRWSTADPPLRQCLSKIRDIGKIVEISSKSYWKTMITDAKIDEMGNRTYWVKDEAARQEVLKNDLYANVIVKIKDEPPQVIHINEGDIVGYKDSYGNRAKDGDVLQVDNQGRMEWVRHPESDK